MTETGDLDNPRKTLAVGCIHGNERAGIAVAEQLAHTAQRGDADIWIVPNLNPDGAAEGTRGNAHGVDLNRNFPWRWQRLSGLFYSGPRPLSEPESRIAYRLLLRLRPHVSIWFHQHMDLVDESGGRSRSSAGSPISSAFVSHACSENREASSGGKTTRSAPGRRSSSSCRPER